MEFNFRAVDDRPSSAVRYFSSERPIRGQSVLPSWAVSPPPPTSGPDPNPDYFTIHDPILHPTNARDALQRQLEKERIREEILAAEVARRRVLEAEVWRELMMEREIAIKKAVGDGLGFEDPFGPMQAQSFDNCFRFSSRSSSPLAMVPRLPESAPVNSEVNKELTAPVIPPPELNKEKLILLAKPNPDLSGLKRKKLPEGPNEIYQNTARKRKKIPKEEWSCALCQVTVSTEEILKGHLNGKRHKANQKRLGAGILVKSSSDAPVSKSNVKLSEPKELETTAAGSSKSGANEERGMLDHEEVCDGSDKKDTGISEEETLEEKTVERVMLDHYEVGDGSDKKNTGISKEKTSEEKKVELPVQKDQCGEDSSNSVEVKTVHMMQRKEEPTKTKRFEVLCEICKVGSNNPKVMEKHMSGKKHMDKLTELRKNKFQWFREENKFQTTNEAFVNSTTSNSVVSSGPVQQAAKRPQQDTENSVAAANMIKEANVSISTTIPVASLIATEKAETVKLQESSHFTKEGNVSIPNAVVVPSWGTGDETKAGRLLEEFVKNIVPTTNVTKEAIDNMPTTTSVSVESFWATEAAENLRRLEALEKVMKARLTE